MDELSRVEAVLRRLEATRGEFWNVPRSTAEYLVALVSTFGVDILEIGTSNGYSGIWMARAIKEMGGAGEKERSGQDRAEGAKHVGRLVTIESHAGRFEMARSNFLEAGVSDVVVQVKGHAPEVFETESWKRVVDEVRERDGATGEMGRGDMKERSGQDGVRAADGVFDLIFIDSTKMEYASYLPGVLAMLRTGGVLVADNCVSHRGELGAFFEEVARLEGAGVVSSSLVEMDNGLLVVKKSTPEVG